MMFIKNENIALRVAEPNDAKVIYRWENDTDIWRVSETTVPYSMHQIQTFLMSNNDLTSERQLRLMIERLDDKKAVGCIDIYDYDSFNGRAGIGILIDKDCRRQGYAKQAVELLKDYCFNILLLNQLYIYTLANNIESILLFESLGFERCGIRKQWYKTNEGYLDQIEYQLINIK